MGKWTLKQGALIAATIAAASAQVTLASNTIDSISNVTLESIYHTDSDSCTLNVTGQVAARNGPNRVLDIDIYSAPDYEQSDVPTSQDNRIIRINGNTDLQLSVPDLWGGRYSQRMVAVWKLTQKDTVTAMAVTYHHWGCGSIEPSPVPTPVPAPPEPLPDPCIGCGGGSTPLEP